MKNKGKDLQRDVLVKAARDTKFRKELLKDPKKVIEKVLGIKLPKKLTVEILQAAKDKMVLMIPEPSAVDSLSDDELAAVAGGFSIGGLVSDVRQGIGNAYEAAGDGLTITGQVTGNPLLVGAGAADQGIGSLVKGDGLDAAATRAGRSLVPGLGVYDAGKDLYGKGTDLGKKLLGTETKAKRSKQVRQQPVDPQAQAVAIANGQNLVMAGQLAQARLANQLYANQLMGNRGSIMG